MALKITKVQVWAADIDDTPGALAKVLQAIGSAGANVQCVIARRKPDQPGDGVVYLTPITGKKVIQAAKAAGLSPAGNIATLRIEGPDKPGQGARIMSAIAKSGVNVRGVSTAVIGRSFVSYLGLDTPADAAKAAKALKSI